MPQKKHAAEEAIPSCGSLHSFLSRSVLWQFRAAKNLAAQSSFSTRNHEKRCICFVAHTESCGTLERAAAVWDAAEE